MINRIFNTAYSNVTDIALLVLRLAIGIWMLSKGLPKVSMLFSGDVQFYSVLGLSSQLSLALTVFVQVIGSVLLIIGLFTRLAAVVLAVNMFVAVVAVHFNDTFAKAEPALHFLLTYVFLSLAGAGKLSLDYAVAQKHINSKKNLYK
jgi:putative oxidoreductase